MLSRRQFLGSSAAAGLALAGRAAAIDPITRAGQVPLRLSIAGYSYRQELDLKKPTLTLDGFIDRCAGLGRCLRLLPPGSNPPGRTVL